MSCSRRTVGLITGGVTLIVNISALIYASVWFNDDSVQADDKMKSLYGSYIIYTFIFTWVIVLFIAGILQKRHEYVLMFVMFGVVALIVSCFKAAYLFTFAMSAFGLWALWIIVIQAVVIAIGYFILKILYELHNEIRDENSVQEKTDGTFYQHTALPCYYGQSAD